MHPFLASILEGPRKIVITGHFGSGKTEFAVSLALALAREGTENIALCDLDIENPYFRSRERQEDMEALGIRVYSDPFRGRNGSELQVIDPAIRAPLEDESCRVICDCGGDETGAMVLNSFRKYFDPGEYALLCVVNPYRPGTDTAAKATEQVRRIEERTGLAVTGFVSNAHLIRDTAPEDVAEGWNFTRKVSEETGIPALCALCMDTLTADAEKKGIPAFPIGMYMRPEYLDKKV